jgi:predicted neutral ceramidase superfamily lipid hydrolase
LEFGLGIFSFVQEFIEFLLSDISSIPFTISLGAAVLLTFMYLANFVSDILLRMIVIPMWVFVIITFFFPSLIPKEYEFVSLIIFALMIFIVILTIGRYRKKREKTRKNRAATDISNWLNNKQLLSLRKNFTEEDIKEKIIEILEKYKLD